MTVTLFRKNRYRWLILAVVVVVILSSAVLTAVKVGALPFGNTSTSNKHPETLTATPSSPEHDLIKVSGVVRDELGRPVVGALVLPMPHGGHPIKTDATGKFEIPGPSEKRLILSLLARDPNRNLATAIELGDYSKPIDITLKPAVTFAGSVTNPQGKPIAGAKVRPLVHISHYRAGFGSTAWPPTDSDGRYEIKALPTGYEYNIDVSAESHGTNYVRLGLLDSPGCKHLEPIVLQPANLSVSGIVLDDNDRPMPGINVQASGQGQPLRKVKTNSEGRFKINRICKGRVSLLAWTSDHLWGGSDEAKSGDNNVEIYIRKGRACMIPPENPPSPLIGKELPDLDELNIHLTEKNIQGKRVLVCFWKMSHDESRDYMRQLAIRSEELAKKDIIIIGVQIWIRNEKQLRRWLARNKINFPVSMLPDLWEQEPEQRAIYRWGVQNLPWLILTDTHHVVRAEGFALEALDENIQQTNTPKIRHYENAFVP